MEWTYQNRHSLSSFDPNPNMALPKLAASFIFWTLLVSKHVSTLRDAPERLEQDIHRQGKLISLFNIIRFKNEACQSTSPGGNVGSCLSLQECTNKGGAPSGNCAAGFGVCCVIAIVGCGGTVNNNCTYVRNDGFPGTDSMNSRTCMVGLNRISSDICQIRLDFESTTQLPLGAELGSCGGTGDSLTVQSPHSSSQSAFPPAICGTLTGQHMYFESGRMGSLAGQINILQGSGTGERRYNIKVTYIECDSRARAPSGCTQFFMGLTGTITSYNFAGNQILEEQLYGNCIRQNEGYCSVVYSETPITSPDPFNVSPVPTGKMMAVVDNCMVDNHVTIPSEVIQFQSLDVVGLGDQSDIITYVPSMRCSKVFGSVPGTTVPGTLESGRGLPFVVNVRTLPSAGGTLADLGGFSLDFQQKPC